jgi:hypothetical protein
MPRPRKVLETLGDPASVVAELRRVTKRAGVEYGGLILADEQTAGPQRFYDIRQQLWRAAGIAEPNTGRRLRGLFHEARFGLVEAFARSQSAGLLSVQSISAQDRRAPLRSALRVADSTNTQRMQTGGLQNSSFSSDPLTLSSPSWRAWIT